MRTVNKRSTLRPPGNLGELGASNNKVRPARARFLSGDKVFWIAIAITAMGLLIMNW
jgi:hypothetical protein